MSNIRTNQVVTVFAKERQLNPVVLLLQGKLLILHSSSSIYYLVVVVVAVLTNRSNTKLQAEIRSLQHECQQLTQSLLLVVARESALTSLIVLRTPAASSPTGANCHGITPPCLKCFSPVPSWLLLSLRLYAADFTQQPLARIIATACHLGPQIPDLTKLY